MVEQTSLNQAWGPLRVILEDNYSFNSIKQVVSLAGVDVTSLAHLEQKSGGGGATKGQLMTAWIARSPSSTMQKSLGC